MTREIRDVCLRNNNGDEFSVARLFVRDGTQQERALRRARGGGIWQDPRQISTRNRLLTCQHFKLRHWIGQELVLRRVDRRSNGETNSARFLSPNEMRNCRCGL